MSSYQLMVRVLREQCLVEEDPDAHSKKVTIKPNKEVSSDSLQNPSDPDAGYDGHKGKGYQVQVAETYSNNEDQAELSLITYVEVEPAHESDANALLPYLEATTEREIAPEQLLADSLYGSDHNCEKAKELGVEVVSPCMGSSPNGQCSLGDFTFSNDGKAVACPQGHAPLETKKKKNRFSAVFASETCAGCPLIDACPVKAGKRGYYLRYDEKTLRLGRRRAIEKTPEFIDKYRFRAGVEGTMSQYDRRTGVKRLRVRGTKAVRFCAFLKATGINIIRTAAFKRGQNVENGPSKGPFSILRTLFRVVKERFIPESALFFRNALEFGLGFQF
jgi:NAD-dependent dihydropyrimidine dehydrogenase PreA subunit